MDIYYNPLDKKCKNIIGAVTDKQQLHMKVFTGNAINSCCLFLVEDFSGKKYNFEMFRTPGGYAVLLPILSVGLYWYHFVADGIIYGRDEKLGISAKSDRNFELLVYSSEFKTPEWFKGGVMYQIFPDRFNRVKNSQNANGKRLREDWGGMPEYKPNNNGKILNNDFFGGNFNGITEKLEYLKSLNVTALYLNPVFEAQSNHRYDIGDYMKFDSLLGTEEDFKKLINKAENLGISIILDGVFNHTGDNSRYFNKYGKYDSVGAYQSEDSVYYSWYTFKNYPAAYECWWDIDILPSINKNSISFQNFIAGDGGVIEKYLKMGVKGFRFDVIDELSENFIKKIRAKMRYENAESLLIGEVWEDATYKIAYGKRRKYFFGDELDSVMNYPLKNAIINYILTGNQNILATTVKEQVNNYPKPALDSLMNILDTHDTPRILTVLGKNGNIANSKEDMATENLTPEELTLGIERLKAATVVQFFIYGVPCIYYGDEAGTEGNKDPFNRKCFPWGNENIEIINWYKKITSLRSDFKFLDNAETRIIKAENGIFVFERTDGKSQLFVCLNFGFNNMILNFSSEVKNIMTDVKDCKFNLNIDSFEMFYDSNI